MPFGLRHSVELPKNPVLVIALEGWIDAGFAAATAVASLVETLEPHTFVTFNADELVDLRARRPRLRIVDGVRKEITWAEPTLLVGTDRLGAGIALLVGPEPDYRWRTFSSEICGIGVELETRLVVGLGGFPASTPHTRPIRLAATASDEALARQVGFVPGAIDVPAAIGDVIGSELSAAGIRSVGLWARVPHYVAAMPFPAAALALVDGLAAVSGLVLDTDELREAAVAGRKRVDELISESAEHEDMVRQLEVQADAAEGAEGLEGELPSGDEIAAELERFLRGENQ